MNAAELERVQAEDRVVAELDYLGICYLSQTNRFQVHSTRPPAELLSALLNQPSSRVRTAVIPLLLAHPEFQDDVPTAAIRLNGPRRRLLELFYSAAVFLQRKYAARLLELQGADFQELHDLFSERLGIPDDLSPSESLNRLAARHRELTSCVANWAGTYENGVKHWLRRQEKERAWNR
jgi:hypothetical protein